MKVLILLGGFMLINCGCLAQASKDSSAILPRLELGREASHLGWEVGHYAVPLQFSNDTDRHAEKIYNYCLPPQQKLLKVDSADAKTNSDAAIVATADTEKNCISVKASLSPNRKFCSDEPAPTFIYPNQTRVICSPTVPTVVEGTLNYQATSWGADISAQSRPRQDSVPGPVPYQPK